MAFARTDLSIMRDILQSYSSFSFPGVVQFVNELEETSPASLYIGKALCLKGESLYRLGRSREALDVLDRAVNANRNDSELCIQSWYWKGRVEYDLGFYETASISFFRGMEIYKEKFSSIMPENDNVNRFNELSILFGGRCFFAMEKYEEAIPLFEYVVGHGRDYNVREYGEVLLSLYESYINVSQYESLLKSYEALPQKGNFLAADIKGKCTILAGDAAVYLGQYKKACEYYKTVFDGEESGFSVLALQKLYGVSSQHPVASGINAAKLLEEAGENLGDYNTVLSEVWIRLAIDAFNSGDYKTSLSYFDSAEKTYGMKRCIIGLYRAEISSRLQTSSERQMNEAVAILDLYENAYEIDIPFNERNDYYAAYLCAYVKWYCVGGKYEESIDYGKKVVQLLGSYNLTDKQINETYYYLALSQYSLGKKKDAMKTLKNIQAISKSDYVSDVPSSLLYARLLIEDSKSKDAISVYESLYSSNKLSPVQIIDYANLLFSIGYITSAQRVALSSSDKESNYIAGLASFNKKEWKNAGEYFNKYISANGKNSSASFYLGYCQYKNGENLSAFNTLAKFARGNSDSYLCFNAHYTAALCAVLLSRFDEAGQEALLASQCAKAKEQKQDAILLCSSIYTDCGLYDKAIEVLVSSANGNDEFAIRSKYQIAQIYALQGNISLSDAAFKEIADRYGSTSFGDESAFRRGEIHYSSGNYGTALSRYNDYISKYKNGNFIDAALYYSGDCLVREGQLGRAEMQYLTLIKGYSDSSYVYSARKNLVQVYKNSGNYASALAEAKSILADYGQQAVKDSISNEIKELNYLVKGENETVVNLRVEYENNGGSSSTRGRGCGTELCELLFENPSTQEEAVNLAQEILSVQKNNQPTESEGAGRTNNVLAKYNRLSGHYKDAANLFIESASYFRSAGKGDESAMSMYYAVESFDACGMTGDALQTYEAMKELYPKSKYVSLAYELVKNY